MHEVAVVTLLAAGSLLAVAGSLGVLAARSFYDRLHYLGVTTICAIPLAVAVAIGEASAAGIAKALLVAAIVTAVGPVLTHAMARAELNREHRAASAAAARRHRRAG